MTKPTLETAARALADVPSNICSLTAKGIVWYQDDVRYQRILDEFMMLNAVRNTAPSTSGVQQAVQSRSVGRRSASLRT